MLTRGRQAPLELSRIEAARLDRSLEPARELWHHRQRPARGAIKLGTVGAGTLYTGTVFGNTMSGSYKTPGGGGKWSARKVIVGEIQ